MFWEDVSASKHHIMEVNEECKKLSEEELETFNSIAEKLLWVAEGKARHQNHNIIPVYQSIKKWSR